MPTGCRSFIQLGGGNGNPLPYSCLRNPMDRGAQLATVHEVTHTDTDRQTDTHTHTQLVTGAIMMSKGDGICLKIFFALQEC